MLRSLNRRAVRFPFIFGEFAPLVIAPACSHTQRKKALTILPGETLETQPGKIKTVLEVVA